MAHEEKPRLPDTIAELLHKRFNGKCVELVLKSGRPVRGKLINNNVTMAHLEDPDDGELEPGQEAKPREIYVVIAEIATAEEWDLTDPEAAFRRRLGGPAR